MADVLDFRALLRPASVAVVGANDDEDTFGGRIWSYLGAYSKVDRMAVNTRSGALTGTAVAPSLSRLPRPPELVVLATPARTVPGLVAEAAALGARAAIVLAQVAPVARPQLLRVVDEAGMVLLGPGSLGLINANDGVVASSSVSLCWPPPRGPLALVAQSGALMGVLHARAIEQGVGMGLCLATGSQLQVRVEHVLAALAAEGDYLVVGAHLEDVDVGLLTAAAESLRRAGRRLVVLKGGLTPPGGAAAASHSGALASDGRAFKSLARNLGIVVASDPDELLARMQACTVAGRRWRFATVSGGLAAVAADLASAAGLDLAPPPPEVKVFPAGNESHDNANPLDLDAVPMTTRETVAAVERLAEDRTADGAVLVVNDKPGLEDLLSGLARLDESVKQRLCLCSECSSQYDHAWRTWVGEGGTFAKGLATLVRALAETRAPEQSTVARRERRGRLLPVVATQDLLAGAGIPVLPLVEVQDGGDLDAVASKLGLPMVLKLAGAEHRGPEGVMRVTSREAARARFELLAGHGEVVAQRLAEPGLEFYVGVDFDAVFGPVFMIGAGGPNLEESRDVAVRIGLPDRAGIEACLGETCAGRWLEGSLGGRLVSLASLVDVASKTVAFARRMARSLASIDLNPVVVGPSGAVVLDAKLRANQDVAPGHGGDK